MYSCMYTCWCCMELLFPEGGASSTAMFTGTWIWPFIEPPWLDSIRFQLVLADGESSKRTLRLPLKHCFSEIPILSINMWTEFLLQFWKQRKNWAILLASNKPQQQRQEKNRLTQKGKEKLKDRRIGKDYEQVGLQEAPHLQDLKQNHFENAGSKNSFLEFFFNKQSSNSFERNFWRIAFYLQKNNKTDHLKDKKLLTTTKPQESVTLTIDNPQLCSHWDIGMNMRHSNHFNTCIIWLKVFVKNVRG